MSSATAAHSEARELEVIEFFINEQDAAGKVSREYYAINVIKVIEIIKVPATTEIPGSHQPAVIGTFDFRGQVLALVDLAAWMGTKIAPSSEDKVIVSEFSGHALAFLVSGATRVVRLNWSMVETPDETIQAISRNSITGIIHHQDRLLFLLDMELIASGIDPQYFAKIRKQAEAAELSLPPGERWKVLVVDDSLPIRTIIAQTLEASGYQVTAKPSAAEALNTLNAWKNEAAQKVTSLHDYVDLVVSDIEMPQMDGHTLTRTIKADPALGNLPVILFSSIITGSLARQGEEAGADAQVSKPELPLLAKKISEIIKKKRGLT